MSPSPEDELSRLRRRIAELEAELARRDDSKWPDDEYRYSVELNPQVSWVASANGAIEDFTQHWLDLTGLTREQTLGDGWTKVVHPQDLPGVVEAWTRAIETSHSYDIEHRIRIHEGGYRWMRSRARPRRNSRGAIARWYGTTEDIHDRKETELLLKNSEQSFSAAFAEAPIGMVLLSPEGTILEVNQAYREMLGYGTEDLAGHDSGGITHPDDVAVTRRFFQELQNGEESKAAIEKRYFHRDGRIIWVKASGTMRRDAQGRPMQVVAIVEDISQRKSAEIERERLLRELEEFAYVSSHDLQEPLRMVNIYTQLLTRELEPFLTEETASFAAQVHIGVERMEQLLKALLNFSRTIADESGAETPAPTADLNISVHQAIDTLEGRIEELRATLKVSRLPMVYGDQAQLAQVFQNLISNALKYRKTEEAPVIQISARSEGKDCVVALRDNGIGFAQYQAERIFGLFKRLHKNEYPGTGLGLAICKRIIERNGGRIWAESKPGEGARFFFSLREVSSPVPPQ